MRARPVRNVKMWYCENCDEYHTDDEGRVITVYYHPRGESITTPDSEDGYEYFKERCSSEDWWWCDSCCEYISKDEPGMSDAWRCSECDSLYPSKSEADECCQ